MSSAASDIAAAGSAAPLVECPPFDDWYRAVNARDPFPWQSRLARHVADTGRWPSHIAIPTGLGKTACVDIAVWALASQADRVPELRTAPTRIWWVVNRRILVDDTYRHVTTISDLLASTTPSPAAAVQAVAARLCSMHTLSGPPLQTLRLRGGESHGRAAHPAQPAVVCSTIPMFGSRLLFRGYGSSRSMRPVDAALAGTDSLVLVDEAHLAAPLRTLLNDVASAGRGRSVVLPGCRSAPKVVSLTATADPAADMFTLDGADRADPVVAARLAAAKPLTVEQTGKKPAAALATAVGRLVGRLGTHPRRPVSVLVFANTPDTALAAAQRLRKTLRESDPVDVLVATGRTRGVEAAVTAAEVARRLAPHRRCGANSRDVVVIATQTLEVGADLDADYLITEACGTRALTQRLGRLNRFGDRPWAQAVYIHTPPAALGWPVYGQEPADVLAKLTAAADEGSAIDMSPAQIAGVLGEPQDRPQAAPALAEGLLQEWAKTSAPPPGEAPVEPYFSGIANPDHDIEMLWRAHLPQPGERIWPSISENETAPVAVAAARESLDGDRCVRVGSDQATAEAVPDRYGRLDLRPGDTVIVAAGAGLLDDDSHWNPDAAGLVPDRSLEHAGFPIAPDVLGNLYPDPPSVLQASLRALLEPGDDPDETADAVTAFCAQLAVHPPAGFDPASWRQLAEQACGAAAQRAARGRPAIVEAAHETARLPILADSRAAARSDEHDELSIAAPATLEAHSALTADKAAQILASCGIAGHETSHIAETAARLHDIGKADSRFQAWLTPSTGGELLAKSNVARTAWQHTRRAAGWPAGGRHEELSRRLTQAWLDACGDLPADIAAHSDLLMHLIVAHHGNGRPLVGPVTDRTATVVSYAIDGRRVETSADLSVTDWQQPARFAALNAQYGYWGLALLEAAVRQADHLASAPGIEIR